MTRDLAADLADGPRTLDWLRRQGWADGELARAYGDLAAQGRVVRVSIPPGNTMTSVLLWTVGSGLWTAVLGAVRAHVALGPDGLWHWTAGDRRGAEANCTRAKMTAARKAAYADRRAAG